MKILTKEQFVKVPYGTPYCTCVNSAFTGHLAVKYEPKSDDNVSWWALDVMPWLETEHDSFCNKPFGDEIKTKSFCTDDAIYNHSDETLYAVFNKKEIEDMIERLKNAIGY